MIAAGKLLAALTATAGGAWLLDQGVRLLLTAAARRWRPAAGESPRRWLVVVPARAEGAAVRPSLESVLAAREGGHDVELLLLLDGPDPEAEGIARGLGATVLVKRPAGPTKAAAMAWLAGRHRELVHAAEAVMILDVGSHLSPRFFEAFRWPAGAAAAQAHLRAAGGGVGVAVGLSEAAAQRWQDRGREALGWSVRLRGTGTVFRPGAFLEIVPLLCTAVEDTEASLLLASAGYRVTLAPEEAWVEDTKPEHPADAARQRARWLLGQLQVLVLRAPALLHLAARRPAEGLALAAELLSRPLVLSLLGRLALAGAWLAAAAGGDRLRGAVFAVLLGGSALAELPLARAATGRPCRELTAAAVAMLRVWLRALPRLPAAARGWLSGRRR